MAAIEIAHPLGKIGTVVGGGDPVAALRIDPVGGVSGKSSREYGSAIFERNGEYTGLAAGGQFQFVPERIVRQVVWRCTRPSFAGADKFCLVVFDRRYALLFRRIPPFVGNDAVSAGVASGEEGGVSGSGAGVGVVVVTVGEIGAAIEKHAEASLPKLVTIAFKIVAAELINHDYDNEPGASVVGGGECGRDRRKQQECRAKQQWRRAEGAGESHRELVYRRTRNPRSDSPPRLSRRAELASFSFVHPRTQERGRASPPPDSRGRLSLPKRGTSPCTESRFSAKVNSRCSI